MDKSINIENIVKQLLADTRFQECVINILSELLAKAAEPQEASNTVQIAQPKVEKQEKVMPEKDWSKASPNALRAAHYYYTTRNRPVPAGLNDALVKTFDTYNPETQKFMGRVKGTKSKPATPAPVKKEKVATTKAKTIDKIDLSKLSNHGLSMVISHRRRAGRPIEPELLAEQERRKQERAAESKAKVAEPIVEKPVVHDKPITQIAEKGLSAKPVANKSEKDDLLNEYRLYKKSKREITPELNARLATAFPDLYDSVNQVFTGRIPNKAESQSCATELHVQLKMVKMTLTDVYNDVIVNGRTILKNHANTELRPLLDGTMLGVYGVITGSKEYPERPLWMIFNTNLEPNRFVSRDKFSGYCTYIKSVVEMPTVVRATCSNKCDILLDKEKYTRLANGRRFIIDEKTK